MAEEVNDEKTRIKSSPNNKEGRSQEGRKYITGPPGSHGHPHSKGNRGGGGRERVAHSPKSIFSMENIIFSPDSRGSGCPRSAGCFVVGCCG